MVTIIEFIARFGIGHDVKLPPGWQLIQSPEDWLKAKAPDGSIYLIGSGAHKHRAFKVKNEKGNKVEISTDESIDLRPFNPKDSSEPRG